MSKHKRMLETAGITDENIYYNHPVTLPQINIDEYAPIKLHTYYPIVSEYPYTGHSKLEIPLSPDTYTLDGKGYSKATPTVIINKTPGHKTYNLLSNNCSDATLDALNYIFNTDESSILFTTPGDVQDIAISKFKGKPAVYRNGENIVYIPRNKNNYKQIDKRALEYLGKTQGDGAYLTNMLPFVRRN